MEPDCSEVVPDVKSQCGMLGRAVRESQGGRMTLRRL